MTDDGIFVPYNRDLKPLEDLLSAVERPGDFFVLGAIEIPMPRVEVEGVGVLSFPVPESQIRQIIAQGTRAPCGRGLETVLDESVRKSWQLLAKQVRIGGKSWAGSFQQVMDRVTDGLGCKGFKVTAQLHKLLVYETGDFFKTHRNTEKSAGMFATLVIVLPSMHRGGDLVIRHAERQVTADLNSMEEVSELRFAAFYADCEHEVLPITEGNRLCLIYNLIQEEITEADTPLTAPLYGAEIEAAGAMLKDAFADSVPAKLAWLLEHDYTAASLSFSGLKGHDAARAKVICTAAERAGCAVHLGIVHIEESGSAEPEYDEGYRYGRRRYWDRYDDDDEEVDEDASSDSFEVIEVCDSSRFIDEWMDASDQPVAFGKLPLEECEVLPAGALDGEEPDEKRLTEYTGNEGATFERSYRRAALVIWPRERFADVLLQAGVGAVLPHLQDRVRSCLTASVSKSERQAVIATAERVIAAWEEHPGYQVYGSLGNPPGRGAMLQILAQLGDARLLTRFLEGVVIARFDGSENPALAEVVSRVGLKKMGELLHRLARENMRVFHQACVELLHRLVHAENRKLSPSRRTALRKMADVIVAELPALQPPAPNYSAQDWWRAKSAKPADAAMVADLLDSLGALDAPALRAAACKGLVANTVVFDPPKLIVPALQTLRERSGDVLCADLEYHRLWCHASGFLLHRSEQPPAAPTNWKQTVTLKCACEDCRALQTFARDAQARVGRFPVRKDRRQHLHRQIEQHGLDMTHVTERKGSPQTLVCTKTRRTYLRQCEQHQADCASMEALLGTEPEASGPVTGLAKRMKAARVLRPAAPDPA